MAATDIKVTEILYDPIQSGNPADKYYEWVEIQNTGTTAVAMNGWTLDDAVAGTTVGTFANTTLQPGQIAIFYNASITEAQFLAANPSTVPGTVLIPVTHWQQLNNGGAGASGGAGDTVNLVDNFGNPIAAVTYTDVATAGNSINYPPAGTQSVGAPNPGVTCFTAGSLIDTEHGPRRIEDLQVGDQIRTLDHGLQTLRWIGQREVSEAEQRRRPALCPIEIEQGALGPNAPLRRTRVSPQHRLLVASDTTTALFDEPRMLCAALSLVGQAGIRQLPPAAPVTYLHILFDQHEVVFVDGQASESFFPSQDAVEALSPLAREELFTLFPKVESAAFPVAYPVMSSAEAALLSR